MKHYPIRKETEGELFNKWAKEQMQARGIRSVHNTKGLSSNIEVGEVIYDRSKNQLLIFTQDQGLVELNQDLKDEPTVFVAEKMPSKNKLNVGDYFYSTVNKGYYRLSSDRDWIPSSKPVRKKQDSQIAAIVKSLNIDHSRSKPVVKETSLFDGLDAGIAIQNPYNQDIIEVPLWDSVDAGRAEAVKKKASDVFKIKEKDPKVKALEKKFKYTPAVENPTKEEFMTLNLYMAEFDDELFSNIESILS